MDLQVARGDHRRVGRAISDLHHGRASAGHGQEEQIAATTRLVVIDRVAREGDCAEAIDDANTMEIDDVYVDRR